ncbi:hypothetical protein J8L85_07540 [Maribacter sp. MMG018]|uniref:hypothetical protein n=1 Tax=Maribacter sp. MMG018 TaxID=2822688 RepID=UPI001B359263|nr:hypothetical protein [Maribacter sp. MMG018]MBQ4914284.1 hypothetical protein [Maribacter sp. MMG018]
MNAKWCVSTLFIILALLGLSQEQKKASNQQISLEFADVELASETAHDEVLAVITKKLLVLGIDAIEVIENDGRQLSIRYYSDLDADSVKEFLSDEDKLPLSNEEESPSDYPKEQLPEKYSIVVSDLQQQTDHGIALTGTLVSIQKQDDNRIFNPVILPFDHTFVFEQNAIVDVAFRIHTNLSIAIDNTSPTIPEVRAGPYAYGNS